MARPPAQRQRSIARSFSLVAEIGWLASIKALKTAEVHVGFQSRCRDWVVGEVATSVRSSSSSKFQSRCRDWVVGEPTLGRGAGAEVKFQSRCRDWVVGERQGAALQFWEHQVSVSLPRLGGWRARLQRPRPNRRQVSVSLPRLGGWRDPGASVLHLGSRVSVSLPRLGGWRVEQLPLTLQGINVSVSLPRLGGWREGVTTTAASKKIKFQSRCRDWVVGELGGVGRGLLI